MDKSLGRKKYGNIFFLNLHCAMPQDTHELSFWRPSIVWLGQTWGVTVSSRCSQENRKDKGMVGRLHFLAKNSHHMLIHIFVFL